MKILCIGDIVSRIGRDMLFKYVDDMKYQKGIDLVIANGENATHGRGLARNAYDELIRAGIDVITMGNHTWDAKEVVDIMRNEGNVIRPANYNKKCPGEGSIVFTAKNGVKVGVVNLIGRTYLDPAELSGKGEAGDKGGPNGDLLLTIRVHPHQMFKREGTNVFIDMPISFVQAALGATVQVPTLDGPVELKIPEGTQTGSKFRMKGRGIPSIRSKVRGDQYVTVNVEVPRNLNSKQKELLREFEEDKNYKQKKSFAEKMKDFLNK